MVFIAHKTSFPYLSAMITSIDQLDFSKTYSYADYLTWKFKERVELIAGRIFRMSPGPNRRHQKVVGEIFRQFANFLVGKSCEVYTAPFDVRFVKASDTPDQQITNTVQPDICVICDPSKLDDKGCLGAPDLIVEILSPSSVKRDMKHKYDLYQDYGVSEYWVIDPYNQIVHINSMGQDGLYQSIRPYIKDYIIKSSTLPGFELDLRALFEEDIDDISTMKEIQAEYKVLGKAEAI